MRLMSAMTNDENRKNCDNAIERLYRDSLHAPYHVINGTR